MTLSRRNYTCASCHLSHIITSIHHTFLPQVHHITPAKGQRPSFTLHIEAKLPHSVLVQLNPRAFSINDLVKKTAPKSNINITTVDFHQPGTNWTTHVPYCQIFQIIRLTQPFPVSIQLPNLHLSPYQKYSVYTSLHLQQPLQQLQQRVTRATYSTKETELTVAK